MKSDGQELRTRLGALRLNCAQELCDLHGVGQAGDPVTDYMSTFSRFLLNGLEWYRGLILNRTSSSLENGDEGFFYITGNLIISCNLDECR